MTGNELRAARLRLGAAQIDVARVFNVSEWTVWAWERGIHPVPAHVNLRIRKPLVGWYVSNRRAESARNRSRGLLRWMRANPGLVIARNRKAASKLSRADRRAMGKLTWAGISHVQRSRFASMRQRRRWVRVSHAERSEYMSALNRLRWASIPANVRSKVMSEIHKAAWAKRSPSERARIVSERVRKGWTKLSASVRSELMRERFWSWFPRADYETQARVMKVLRMTAKSKARTSRLHARERA